MHNKIELKTRSQACFSFRWYTNLRSCL